MCAREKWNLFGERDTREVRESSEKYVNIVIVGRWRGEIRNPKGSEKFETIITRKTFVRCGRD
jgi:hypothetical protein